MPVWTEKDIRLEELRGVFAIGMIATLVAYWELHSKVLAFYANSLPGYFAVWGLNYVSIILMLLWGLYILLTAASMSFSTGKFDTVFRMLRSIGEASFFFGTILALIFGSFFFAISAMIQTISIWTGYPVTFYYSLGLGYLSLVIVMIFVGMRWKRRHKSYRFEELY
jgi:hypothetical protein